MYRPVYYACSRSGLIGNKEQYKVSRIIISKDGINFTCLSRVKCISKSKYFLIPYKVKCSYQLGSNDKHLCKKR